MADSFACARRLAVAVAIGIPLSGCAAINLVGGMAQNYEYSKQIQVLPEYDGLVGKTVTVLVDVDLATTYDHPRLAMSIADAVARGLQANVEGVRVMPARTSLEWQYRTPGWNALSFAELAEALGTDRIIYIDVTEYRLNPPGNRYEWDGVCAANVYVIEADGPDPDASLDWQVSGRFPGIKGVGWESAPRDRIEAGVLIEFTRQTCWLFYEHLEPKYPDRLKEA